MMKFKVWTLAFPAILLSSTAFATNVCTYGTSDTTDDLIVDLQLCSGFNCNVRGTTIFDRDSLSVGGSWAWADTSTSNPNPTSQTNGGGFAITFDNVAKIGGSFLNGTLRIQPVVPVGVGVGFGSSPLSPGDHTAQANLNFASGKSCSETATVHVEASKVYGQLESAAKGGEISGGACIKGTETNRKVSPSVELWAGPGNASNVSLGSVVANLTNSTTAVASACGSNAGFKIQLTERQQQDYCDQPLWATVKDKDLSHDVVLTGSQNYLVPCALRPYVGNVALTNKTAVTATGSNFKSGTKVEVLDVNGTSWGVLPISFNGSSSIAFTLPDMSPPSRCNKFAACNVTIRFTNPDGQAVGTFTDALLSLPNLSAGVKPVIGTTSINTASKPNLVTVYGSALQSDANVDVFDNNGNLWGKGTYSYVNTGTIIFQLPGDMPPSQCNISGSCTLKAQINNAFVYSTQGSKDYVSTSFNFQLPRFLGNSIVAAWDNLGTCNWSYINYVGSSGPNVSGLYCSGNSVAVLTKTDSSGICYLGSAAQGYYLGQAGSTCSNFILYQSASVTPSVPANVTAKINNTSVDVTWTGSSGAHHYDVYRSLVYLATVTGTSFNDTTGTGGKYYAYTVKACSVTSCSNSSNDTAADGVTYPTSNTTDFNLPTHGGTILGADLTPVPNTTYFSSDSVDYILNSTANAFCQENGNIAATSYVSASNYGNGHVFQARGLWYTYGGGPFKQITSVRCYK